MSVLLRAPVESDAARVQSWLADRYSRAWLGGYDPAWNAVQLHEPPHTYVLLVEDEGLAVGFIHLDSEGPSRREAYLSICTAPDARNRGVARAALAVLAETPLPFDRLLATCARAHPHTAALLRASGFEDAGEDSDGFHTFQRTHRVPAG